jgi:circadian clock protein KaiB
MILVSHFMVKGITAMFCSLTHEKPEKRFSADCAARLAQTRSASSSKTAHGSRCVEPMPVPQRSDWSGAAGCAASRQAGACRQGREGGRNQSTTRSPLDLESKHMSKRAADSLDYNLRLYVAGQTPKSIAAICNLRRLCEKYLSGRYNLDVIDLMTDPYLARRDHIIAIPTLVRHMPGPIKRIIGDLSNGKRVLTRLGIDVGAKA